MLVKRRRDTRAALRLMRKLLKKQGFAPFLLEPSGTGTFVRLRHYNLPASSFDAHDREWALGGLPKLKAVAEGRDPGGRCLSSQGR